MMRVNHIVVATDESVAARQAVEVAARVARVADARVTALRVMPIGAEPIGPTLDPFLTAEIRIDAAVAFGVPSVEICRFAEDHGGDLLVLGRKPGSQLSQQLGDTADAVIRRSRVPCLLLPLGAGRLARVLGAVDGTMRGLTVVETACDFAHAVGGSLRLVTVEVGEPVQLAAAPPSGRSEWLIGAVREQLDAAGVVEEGRRSAPVSSEVVSVRRGEPVEQVLAAARASVADVLAIGYHRGGPPGILEAGSTARRLVHSASCAVLTVPL